MSYPIFDYASLAFASWQNHAKSLREEGGTDVIVPIYWGSHETLPGAPDFFKPSYLRLEKLLTILHAEGLKAHVELGFFPSARSFPQWAFEGTSRSLIPKFHWGEGGENLSLISIPSLYDSNVWKGFLSFLRSAGAILDLYQSPEGPILDVKLRLDLFEFDLGACDCPDMAFLMKGRYGTIEELNRCYQTSFRDFSSVASSSGWRALTDRRPWLSAFDYKWCRSRLFQKLSKVIQTELPQMRIGSARTTPAQSRIVMDSVLIDEAGDFPFFPSGHVTEAGASSFRLREYLSTRGEVVSLLPGGWETEPEAPSSFTHFPWILCGSFLSRSNWTRIKSACEEGRQFFFPLGLPKYDEELVLFEGISSSESLREEGLSRTRLGKGVLWSYLKPATLEASSLGFWNETSSRIQKHL